MKKTIHKCLSVTLACVMMFISFYALAGGTDAEPTPTHTPGIETQADIQFELISAYQRAEQFGLEFEIRFRSDAAKRMRDRLNTLIRDSSDEMTGSADAGARAIIENWLTATATNTLILLELSSTTSDNGVTVRVPEDYLKSYDFLAIGDAEGRVMLYPIAEYSVDLMEKLSQEARPLVQAMMAGAVATAGSEVIGAVTNTAVKTALNIAFQAQIDGFALTTESIRALLEDRQSQRIGEGTLAAALNISSDLTIGGLGTLKPVIVATGANATEAAYRLTRAEGQGVFTGVKLAEPKTLTAIKADSTGGEQLWLNEKYELVYLRSAHSWLSADAKTLGALLEARGGNALAIQAEEEEEEPTEAASLATWIIVLGWIAAVLLILGAAIFILHQNAVKRRRRITVESEQEGEHEIERELEVKREETPQEPEQE